MTGNFTKQSGSGGLGHGLGDDVNSATLIESHFGGALIGIAAANMLIAHGCELPQGRLARRRARAAYLPRLIPISHVQTGASPASLGYAGGCSRAWNHGRHSESSLYRTDASALAPARCAQLVGAEPLSSIAIG